MGIAFRFVIAVMSLPEPVPALIQWGVDFVQKLTNNHDRFSNPNPALDRVSNAITALERAETAKNSGLKGARADRDKKEKELRVLLRQLMFYVQMTADADPDNAKAIIESAGLRV